jgi:multimeric flavodoxin WrbA
VANRANEVVSQGEMMHRYRYEKYPEIDFYFDNSSLSGEEENVLEDYLFRMAYQFRVGSRRITTEGEGIKIRDLEYREAKPEFLKKESCTSKKGKVIIYNGSPRGLKGNSLILAKEIAKGLETEGLKETDYEIRNLTDQKSHKLCAEDFKNNSRNIFVFPLYIHSMPSIVMKFFEQLKPLSSENQMTFVVQSGFSESAQSHYLRSYLTLFVKRLGAAYGGTVIKGGVEGIQMQPEKANRKLFDKFNQLGREIMKDGAVSDALINELAGSIHLKKSEIVLFRIISKTGLTNFYWDMQLKKNGAFKERFSRPYVS